MTSQLPDSVAGIVDSYLRAVDGYRPGLIEGLYLVGSVALGDYREGTSDIDFVAVTRARLLPGEVTLLREVHAGLSPATPFFDGVYVTWADLRGDPARAQPVPHSHAGSLSESDGFDANPVVWQNLRQHPVTFRGPEPETLEVWFDGDRLQRWSLENLNGYWADLLGRWRKYPPREGLLLHPHGLPWAVLGVSRLYYTIATLEITSKFGAGRYALATFDRRWHHVISACLAAREGQAPQRLYGDVDRVWRDGLGYMAFVIAEANQMLATGS